MPLRPAPGRGSIARGGTIIASGRYRSHISSLPTREGKGWRGIACWRLSSHHVLRSVLCGKPLPVNYGSSDGRANVAGQGEERDGAVSGARCVSS